MTSPDFYREALAYDIAFADRDYALECDFLDWCLKTYGSAPGGSFLELGCGPARHAREFARRGWRAVGLDLSQDMLDYALAGAARDGVRIEPACADMTNFNLPAPVSIAANLMESLTHLTTNAQVVAHLRAVARNLLPGGVFVIEMAHPDSIWRDNLPNVWLSKSTDMPFFTNEPYTEVDVLFGSADDPFDWFTQQWLVTTRLRIRQAGQPERVVEEHHPHRWYMAQELSALVELSGAFEGARWFGDISQPPPPFDNQPSAERMILVLTKAG